MSGEPDTVDLPVVPSVEALKKVQGDIEVLKAQVADLQTQIENLAAQIGSLPADVKAAAVTLAKYIETSQGTNQL